MCEQKLNAFEHTHTIFWQMENAFPVDKPIPPQMQLQSEAAGFSPRPLKGAWVNRLSVFSCYAAFVCISCTLGCISFQLHMFYK